MKATNGSVLEAHGAEDTTPATAPRTDDVEVLWEDVAALTEPVPRPFADRAAPPVADSHSKF